MRGDYKFGLFGLFALMTAIYLLWIVVLYAGIPVAVIGIGVALYLNNKHRDDNLTNRIRKRRRDEALALGCCSLFLGCVSLVGNIYSEDGPFSSEVRAETKKSRTVAQVEDEGEKVYVDPQECAALKSEVHTAQSIKAMCYRMSPSDSWGDSAARSICFSQEMKKLRACGADVIQSY